MEELHKSLFNSEGFISEDLPFLIFESIPKVGSSLTVTIENLFGGGVESIRVEIQWNNLPENLTKYYEGYEMEGTFNNHSFKVDFYLVSIDNEHLKINDEPLSLFQESNGKILDISLFHLNLFHPKKFKQEVQVKAADRPKQLDGKIIMQLSNPPQAFGHAVFPEIFSKVAIKNSRLLTRLFKRIKPLPKQPLTLIADRVSVFKV